MFNKWVRVTTLEQIEMRSNPDDKTFSFYIRTRESTTSRWSRWRRLIQIPTGILIEFSYIVNMATNERIDLLPCIGGEQKCEYRKEQIATRKAIRAISDGWEV